jgi:hypothetical protein
MEKKEKAEWQIKEMTRLFKDDSVKELPDDFLDKLLNIESELIKLVPESKMQKLQEKLNVIGY